MNISKYNAEGYPDPTAYEAITAIEKRAKAQRYSKLVYICSPFAGNIQYNVNRARGYSRFAVAKGAIPLAPHLLFPQFMEDADQEERKQAINMGLVLLSKCQEFWCFGNRLSAGMAIELERAKQLGLVIRYFNELCQEVQKL